MTDLNIFNPTSKPKVGIPIIPIEDLEKIIEELKEIKIQILSISNSLATIAHFFATTELDCQNFKDDELPF